MGIHEVWLNMYPSFNYSMSCHILVYTYELRLSLYPIKMEFIKDIKTNKILVGFVLTNTHPNPKFFRRKTEILDITCNRSYVCFAE